MYYVLDENNNKVEALDKAGVLAVLQQAINDGSLEGIVADAGAVDKIKCATSGVTHEISFVTQAKYNELSADNQLVENELYIITDDDGAEYLEEFTKQSESNKQDIAAIKAIPKLKKATFTSYNSLVSKLTSIINGNENNSSNIIQVSLKFNSKIECDGYNSLEINQTGQTINNYTTKYCLFEKDNTYNLKLMSLSSLGEFVFSTAQHTLLNSLDTMNISIPSTGNTISASALSVIHMPISTGFYFYVYQITSKNVSEISGEFSVLYYE